MFKTIGECLFVVGVIVLLGWLIVPDLAKALENDRARVKIEANVATAKFAWISAVDQCIESRPDDGFAQQQCFQEIPVGHYIWLAEQFDKQHNEDVERDRRYQESLDNEKP